MPYHDEQGNHVSFKLNEIGCCKLCVLRFVGETDPEQYVHAYRCVLIKDEGELHENDIKVQKCNPCIVCLGLLQKSLMNEILLKVQNSILQHDYESVTFNVALTLPVSYQLRAHSLWLYMTMNFSDFCSKAFPLNLITVSVKDVWKWVISPIIGERVNKTYHVNSDLTVTITISYADDLTESMFLLDMDGNKFGSAKGRYRNTVFSRKNVEIALNSVNRENFTKSFSVPPSIPTVTVTCESVSLHHNSIFIAGRYNKMSRHLSQTAWLIDGERRMDDSIHEIIAEPIENFSKSISTKFLASGREDVDVRTLGRGRPFAVECLDPHRTIFTFQKLREIESLVNKNGYGKVAVRDLQIVGRDTLDSLKTGEEKKTKEYCALCVVHGPMPVGLEKLSTLVPLTITQRTPVRVLHRRPAAARLRTIHQMAAVPCDSDDPDYSLFKLMVTTQAGTYIKEFVHGDFGRTKPSVGDLLGGISVDILALDVMDVNLDWPEPVDYKQG